jgi:acetyl esterase/lipase
MKEEEDDNENDLEYHLNDPGEIKQQIKKNQLKSKIFIGIIIALTILFLGVFGFFIYYFFIRKKQIKFSTILNTKYGDDINRIENTFKINGSNYNIAFGNVNKGEDYGLNPDKNIYDLFIPNDLDKNKYNKILLFIHGGFWVKGDKSLSKPICEDLANQGYITASMGYSLLNSTNYNSSIFRILDEVASAIKSIKKALKEKGFNESKLELAIGGASSGSQIALLYAYFYKKSPLDIKFAINLVGPVTFNFSYYYQIKNLSKPLDNIEQESIDKAIKENTIEPIKAGLNGVDPIGLLNLFFGYKYNEITMQDKRCLDLLRQFQLVFPIEYADKNVVPTLCLYAGKDTAVGVRQYSYLKSKFVDKNKIDIYYCKNLTHDIYVKDSQDSNKCFNELYAKISNFTNKYFSKNK